MFWCCPVCCSKQNIPVQMHVCTHTNNYHAQYALAYIHTHTMCMLVHMCAQNYTNLHTNGSMQEHTYLMCVQVRAWMCALSHMCTQAHTHTHPHTDTLAHLKRSAVMRSIPQSMCAVKVESSIRSEHVWCDDRWMKGWWAGWTWNTHLNICQTSFSR